MKRFFLLVPVVAIVAMSSCKKDYVCSCTTTTVYDSFSSYEIGQDIDIKATSKNAEGNCKSYEDQQIALWGDPEAVNTSVCKIK